MKVADQAISRLRLWLSSTDGYSAVLAFTCSQLKRDKTTGSLSVTWPFARWQDCDQDNRADLGEEVTQAFITFILSGIDLIAANPTLIQKLLSGDFRVFLSHRWTAFIWHWQEKGRGKNTNPLGYLYRRFREELVGNEKLATWRGQEGQLYFSADGSPGPPKELPLVLTDETFRDWPSPPEPIPCSATGELRVSRSWLLNTAEFFLQQAESRGYTGKWCAVRDLLRYLGVISPWLYQLQKSNDPTEGDSEQLDTLPAVGDPPEDRLQRMRQLDSIRHLARQLVDTWNRIECCVFAWRVQEKPLAYAAVADQLGLKDHNQAFSLFKKAKQSIQLFCSNWPGPAITDLSDGVAVEFVDQVRDCATIACSRL